MHFAFWILSHALAFLAGMFVYKAHTKQSVDLLAKLQKDFDEVKASLLLELAKLRK